MGGLPRQRQGSSGCRQHRARRCRRPPDWRVFLSCCPATRNKAVCAETVHRPRSHSSTLRRLRSKRSRRISRNHQRPHPLPPAAHRRHHAALSDGNELVVAMAIHKEAEDLGVRLDRGRVGTLPTRGPRQCTDIRDRRAVVEVPLWGQDGAFTLMFRNARTCCDLDGLLASGSPVWHPVVEPRALRLRRAERPRVAHPASRVLLADGPAHGRSCGRAGARAAQGSAHDPGLPSRSAVRAVAGAVSLDRSRRTGRIQQWRDATGGQAR